MFDLIDGFPREIGTPQRFLISSKERFLDLVNKYNGHKRLFFALYKCDINRKYDNANLRLIFFDFDEKDAIEDTKKLHSWCMKENIKHLMCMSGNGYHVYIFTKNGKILKNNKKALWNVHHDVCKQLGLNLDKHIKGDICRISRIPNTYNGRRRRYCIPISIEDLEKGDEFIREKAKKQNFEFNYYGEALFDMLPYDGKKDEKYEFAVLDAKVKKEIDTDALLKKLPLCVASLLKNGECGWRERYLIITFLRDQGYMLSETISILEKFLTKEKYKHCVFEEKQPQNLYHRQELFFPSCAKVAKEGYCIKNCKWHNKVYL